MRIALYALAGLLGLGALLDSIQNAISLLTPLIAAIATIVVVLSWAVISLILRVHPITWVAEQQQIRIRRLGIRSIAFALGMIALLWLPTVIARIWPAKPRVAETQVETTPDPGYQQIEGARRAEFLRVLSSASGSRERIRMGCAASSEKACAFAGHLLELFTEAKWPLEENGVQRGVLRKPKFGIVLFKLGESKQEPPPGYGVWVVQTPALLTIREAFHTIGIQTDNSADPQMPEGVIGVFVGPALRRGAT